MKDETRQVNRRRERHHALSLAETLVCIVLVGGLLAVSMNLLADAVEGQQGMGDRSRGLLLAQDLMAEILNQPYEEPDEAAAFGRESLEDTGKRDAFDDVDDYDGWNASPPMRADGTEIPDLADWNRSVTVRWLQPNDLTAKAVTETGIKEIAVTVTHRNVRTASLTAVRTRAGDAIAASPAAPIEDPGP